MSRESPPHKNSGASLAIRCHIVQQGQHKGTHSPPLHWQLDEQVEDSGSVDYEKEHVSRQVFNRDTDKAIIRNLMENGIRNADGTRLGKSIIFARNHAHAKQLVEVWFPCLQTHRFEPKEASSACSPKLAVMKQFLLID